MTHPPALVVRTAVGLLIAWAGALSLVAPVDAHKAITSKYFYNEDLFPLFRDKCGRCHIEGGVAPMSLLTYEDAAPWAESLRLEFLSEDGTHPWRPITLSPRELDMMLVWANGGTPRGDVSKTPKPVPITTTWASGLPDVRLEAPAPFVLAPERNDASHELVLPAAQAAGRTLRAIDLLPGNAAIVRSAELSLRRADGSTAKLASWFAGDPQAAAIAPPLLVPPGAAIVATIEYRRTWKYEAQALQDASTVGLYLTAAAGR